MNAAEGANAGGSAPLRIDLHRHLEGSLRPSLLAAAARREASGHRPGALRAAVIVGEGADDLLSYLARIDVAAAVLTSTADWVQAGSDAVDDAFDDGLDYLELRFSPWFAARQSGLRPRAVVDAVHEGVARAAARTGLPVGLIATVVRDLGPDSADDQLLTVLESRDVWCAIDLAGDEAGYPAAEFAGAFSRARDAGLHVTVHAGEAAGPASVTAAIDLLGAERIGHGVRSAEDPRLMERLVELGTTLELALTSNTQTRASPGYRNHQIHALIEAGVPVTLNTDNPTTSGTRLSEEHRRALSEAGLGPARLAALCRHSALAAFTPAGRALAVPASARPIDPQKGSPCQN